MDVWYRAERLPVGAPLVTAHRHPQGVPLPARGDVRSGGGPGWRRRDLLHQAGEILLPPFFDDLATRDPVHARPGDRHRLAARRDTEEIAPVGAGPMIPGHHFVSPGDRLLDDRLQVG